MIKNFLKIATSFVVVTTSSLYRISNTQQFLVCPRLASHQFLGSSRSNKGGYVVILNTLIFVAVSTIVIYALSNPLISANRATADILNSKRAFVAASSVADEVLYKMKNQLSVPTQDVITLGGIDTAVSVATNFSGRVVQVESDSEDVSRRLRVAVSESQGVSFNYGMQTGQGGFELYGGAQVHGNIYSNGNIIGHGGAQVHGSVTVANGQAPTLEVVNSSLQNGEVLFGGQLVHNDQKPEDLAQSFRVSTTTPITSVRVYIKKYANVWMNDIEVKIVNDNGGRPGNTVLASGLIGNSHVTTSYNYITVPFSNSVNLNPNNTYWLVFDTSNTWHSYYVIATNQNIYNNGIARTGIFGGNSWNDLTPNNRDILFDIYVGGQTGRISGNQNNRINVHGDAWANVIEGANVSGVMYCQGGSYANKSCDSSRPDPVPQPFPVSDGNIEAWKQEAEAGGVYNGDFVAGNYPTQHVTLGARKINGNLRVTSGGSLTIEGTVWVTGNVTIDGGAILRTSSSYGSNSGVIVADGRIIATGGGKIENNNVNGNYILAITTSSCPDAPGCNNNPAILVDGGSGSIILNAQNGTLRVTGGAKAKQLTAKKIIMDGGTEVRYETGLMDLNFNTGPSGSWSVSEWSEI